LELSSDSSRHIIAMITVTPEARIVGAERRTDASSASYFDSRSRSSSRYRPTISNA
jgi:hypothetical protein